MENEYRAGAGLSMILGNVWADLRPCRPPSTSVASNPRSAPDDEAPPFTPASGNSPREWPPSANAARAD